MLKTRFPLLIALSALILFVSACSGNGSDEVVKQVAPPDISGEIVDGLRVLTIDPTSGDQHFTIYRGDYVRARLTTGEPFTLKIDSLKVNQQFPPEEGGKSYFKVPNPGTFAFTAAGGGGVIEAVDFVASGYREVSATEGSQFIASAKPLIIDVRTQREYADGHIENSILIPVQVFQKRVGELAKHKNDPIFVYCRSGNRSTVAAKVLMDQGFTSVVNLRRGMKDWIKAGQPVVK